MDHRLVRDRDANLSARLNERAPSPPASYDRRVGNTFAPVGKFSKKSTSTVRQMVNKKGRRSAPLFRNRSAAFAARILPFRQLERPARLGAAVLLAFDDARIACEKSTLLEDAAQVRFEIG